MTQRSSHESFTDREDAIEAFAFFISPASKLGVLSFYGFSGEGKTTLLRHLERQIEDKSAILDLDSVVLAPNTQVEITPFPRWVMDQVAIAIQKWTGTFPATYRATCDAADADETQAPSSSEAVTIEQRATRATIQDSPITVSLKSTAPPLSLLRNVHQRRMLRALADDLSQTLPKGYVVFIDSFEQLMSVDVPSDFSHSGTELAGWFLSEFLPTMITTSPLRFVLAGREAISIPASIEHRSLDLKNWSSQDTVSYLSGRGVTDPAIAEAAHSSCDGHPGWTALLVDAYQRSEQLGRRLTIAEISTAAANEPVREWLPSIFLSRIPVWQQEIVVCSSITRTITKECLAFMLGDTTRMPPNWYEQFAAYSFLSLDLTFDGTGIRRMHDLVRGSLLTYMAIQEPLRLAALHRRAAQYFAEIGNRLEHLYHELAVHDEESQEDWLARIDDAWSRNERQTVSNLVDIALAKEQMPVLSQYLPRVIMSAYNFGSRLDFDLHNYFRAEYRAKKAMNLADQLEDAEVSRRSRLTLALSLTWRGEFDAARELVEPLLEEDRVRRMGDDEKEARHALVMIDFSQGNYTRAIEHTETALRAAMQRGDEMERAEALRQLATLENARGDSGGASDYLRQCLKLLGTKGNVELRIQCLFDLGNTALGLGDCHQAASHLQSASTLAQANDRPRGQILYQLATAEMNIRRTRTADSHLAEAMAEFEESADILGQATTTLVQGLVAFSRGAAVIGETKLRSAIKLYRSIGDREGIVEATMHLIRQKLNDPSVERLFDEPLHIAVTEKRKRLEADVRMQLAHALIAHGKYGRASENLARAREIYEGECMVSRLGYAGLYQIILDGSRRNYDTMSSSLERCATLFRQAGELKWADSLEKLANQSRTDHIRAMNEVVNLISGRGTVK